MLLHNRELITFFSTQQNFVL